MFLAPPPVERVWGVGTKTAGRLRDRGIASVGDLARAPSGALEAMLGRVAGRHLHALANNNDPRPVRRRQRRRSIGAQSADPRSRRSPEATDLTLISLVERVMRRLRAARRVTRTVVLRLRFEDFSRATRSSTLAHPTSRTATVLETARILLAEAGPLIARRGLTLIGVTLTNLADDLPSQLLIPLGPDDSDILDVALDEIRGRFGPEAISRAALLGRGPELVVPLLPDLVDAAPCDSVSPRPA